MLSFEYLAAGTVEEAVSLLNTYRDRAKVLAAGTDLVVQMRRKLVRPQYVVDISRIPFLDQIGDDRGQGLRIGALATIDAIERSTVVREKYGILCAAARQHSSAQIRNVATIGGNLCNASPAADMAPALMALSARVRIIGSQGERVVPLEDFFTGPGSTILSADEVLVEVQIPAPGSATGGAYLKYGVRGEADVAIVGVAVWLTLDSQAGLCRDARIVLASVASTPLRARKAERMLAGKHISDMSIEEVARSASEEARPISDIRGSAQYRRQMVKVFTGRALSQALARAPGK